MGETGVATDIPISFLYKKDSKGAFRLKYAMFCTECHTIQFQDSSRTPLGKITGGFYMPGHHCGGQSLVERVINCEKGEAIFGFGVFHEPLEAMNGWKMIPVQAQNQMGIKISQVILDSIILWTPPQL